MTRSCRSALRAVFSTAAWLHCGAGAFIRHLVLNSYFLPGECLIATLSAEYCTSKQRVCSDSRAFTPAPSLCLRPHPSSRFILRTRSDFEFQSFVPFGTIRSSMGLFGGAAGMSWHPSLSRSHLFDLIYLVSRDVADLTVHHLDLIVHGAPRAPTSTDCDKEC